MDEMLWPTSHNGKVVYCTLPCNISNLNYNWWEANQLEVIVNPPLEVFLFRYGQIYKILSN